MFTGTKYIRTNNALIAGPLLFTTVAIFVKRMPCSGPIIATIFIEYDLHPFVRLLHGWLVFLYHCYFLDIIYFVNLCRYTYTSILYVIKRQKKISMDNQHKSNESNSTFESTYSNIKKEERLKAPPY
jgi:hypothetical protein